MGRVILTYFRVFVVVCGLGIEWRGVRGLEVGQFARIQWFGLSTRALTTVLEPDLVYLVSLTRDIDVVGFAIPELPSHPKQRGSRYPYEWPCRAWSSLHRHPRGSSGRRDYFAISRLSRLK
jgi:hypothetical protein